MTQKRLRAVSSDDIPAAPKSVAEAAETGDLRALLIAMRKRIATAVSNPECPPRDLASLTRRLHEIAKQIEAIDLADAQEVAGRGNEVTDEAFDSSAI